MCTGYYLYILYICDKKVVTAAFPGSPLFLLLEDSLRPAASLPNCLQMHPMNLAYNGFYPANRLNVTTGQTLSSIIPSLLVTVIVLNGSQSHLLYCIYALFFFVLNVTRFIIRTCVMRVPIYSSINIMKVLNSV